MPSFIFSTNSNALSGREKVADWAGHKKKSSSLASVQLIDRDQKDDWEDVHTNIKQMDQFYDATFYAWLKSEENVLVTSIYLHRIANQYPLERVINAFEWLTNDWRWESTSILVRHVTVDWCDEEGDIKRAKLLGHLTMNWATHFTATLITTILISSPYSSCSVSKKRERFIREFTKDWDFSKLSEFFMFLRSRANIDYKFKCMLLQEAARKDNSSIKKGTSSKKSSDLISSSNVNTSNTSTSAGNSSISHHHRRTSSNDFQEMKRTILEEMEEENHHHPPEQSIPPSFSSMNDRCYNTCVSTNSSSGSGTNNASPSTSSATTTATAALHVSSSSTSSRYHHVNITSGTNNTRLCTSSSTLTMTVTNAANSTISSSTSTSTASTNHTTATSDITPSPSSSTNNTNSNNNDKRRITVI